LETGPGVTHEKTKDFLWPPQIVIAQTLWWCEHFDPVFCYNPIWMKLMAGVSPFIYSPFYIAAVYAFIKGRFQLPSSSSSSSFLYLLSGPLDLLLFFSSYFLFSSSPSSPRLLLLLLNPGKEWIREVGLMYSWGLFYTLSIILAEEYGGVTPSLNFPIVFLANAPYCLFPLFLIWRLWPKHPFTSPTSSPTTIKKTK
jgi:hypothetical protein